MSKEKTELLLGKIKKSSDKNPEELLIVEDFEGECERCALNFKPKVCSMC